MILPLFFLFMGKYVIKNFQNVQICLEIEICVRKFSPYMVVLNPDTSG